MFSVADIREIAVQIERNGEAAYRQAAELVSDQTIAEIFNWMADEEKRHAQWFSTIEAAEPLTEEQVELEQMGRQLLQEMVADQTFSLDKKLLAQTPAFAEALEQARLFEKDTVMFYEFLLNLISEEQPRLELERVIREEKRHMDQLEEMKSAGPEACRNLALV
ncbi:MAG: ferritin family protein [Desulfocapsaceae bacterium]